MGHGKRDEVHRHLAERRRRLTESRALSPLKAVLLRFKEIDGANQGVLVSVQLFTVVIPLMILGFSYSRASPRTSVRAPWDSRTGSVRLHQRHRSRCIRRQRSTAVGLDRRRGRRVHGLGVSRWRSWWRCLRQGRQREQFGASQRLLRSGAWFLLRCSCCGSASRSATPATQVLMFAVALIPVWAFWSLTPLVLVVDGGHGQIPCAGRTGRRGDHRSSSRSSVGRIIFPG